MISRERFSTKPCLARMKDDRVLQPAQMTFDVMKVTSVSVCSELPVGSTDLEGRSPPARLKLVTSSNLPQQLRVTKRAVSHGSSIREPIVDSVDVSHIVYRALPSIADAQITDAGPTERADVLEPC